MTSKMTVCTLASVCLLAAGSGAFAAKAAFKGAQYQSEATVTLSQARAIAMKARQGKITDQELEKEAGGSGLRYSFDMVSHGAKFEVGVDAKSGDVLENAAEGSHPD